MSSSDASAPLALDGVGVVFSTREPKRYAVSDVSLTLTAAERTSIIGASGAGKSTVARVAVGLLRANRGTVRWNGQDITSLSGPARRARRASIQLLFQDSWGALDPRHDARTSIEAPLRIHGRWTPEAAAELAETVRLPRSLLDRRPPEMSGGERQRVALARALALRPPVLILDEPLTGLDAPVAVDLRTRILELQRELRMATLWITHDLAEAATVADSVVVMAEGRIVERGPPRDVLEQPKHPATKALLEAAVMPRAESGREH